MKLISMRGAVALATVLSLSACGGGKATFPITVTVSGVQYSGLILTTNGQDLKVEPTGKDTVTVQFPKELEYGDVYNVTIKPSTDDPQGRGYALPYHEGCTVSGVYGTGTAGQFAQINIPVSCSLEAHTIGGTISGMTAGSSVELVNGSTGGNYIATAPDPAPTDPIRFIFPIAVTYGDTYGVTVLPHPDTDKLVCSVANGAGTMGDSNVSDIAVTCVPK